MAGKTKVKKIFGILANVLLYVFIALCLCCVIFSIISKKDPDGTANIFGYQIRFVQSNSMEECDQTDVSAYEIKDIPVKSLVFIKTVPEDDAAAKEWYKTVKVGDVLTFKYVYTRQVTITHRVTEIAEKPDGSGYLITLAGDNKNSDSETLTQTVDTSLPDSPNYIIGRVTGVNHFLGVLVYALKSRVGLVCFVIVPCLLVIAFEIWRIVNAVTADKKQKREAEGKKQQQELEELRRKLAALEGAKAAEPLTDSSEGAPPDPSETTEETTAGTD
ncbi:MAG: hypothetical protein ACI4SH_02925 [Candidatus Scatosoma sp.]